MVLRASGGGFQPPHSSPVASPLELKCGFNCQNVSLAHAVIWTMIYDD